MAITYTEVFTAEIDPDVFDVWTDVDLFTGYGIPKSSVAEILITDHNTGAERFGGIRTNGSGVDRRWLLRECEFGASTAVSVLVQLDADGIVEFYQDDGNVRFQVIGYFEGVTYTEKNDNFSPAGDGAFEDKDLNTDYGYPVSRVYEIVGLNTADAASNSMGVRTNGSSVDRRVTLEEAESGGGEPASWFVQADASGIIEVYSGDHTTAQFYVAGYFDDTVEFTERQDTLDAAGDAGWEDEALNGYGVPSGAIVSCLCCNDLIDNELLIGVREDGSVINRYIDIHEAEAGGLTTYRSCVTAGTDANRTIDIYEEDTSEMVIYHHGWFSDVAVGAVTNLGGSILPLAARIIGII